MASNYPLLQGVDVNLYAYSPVAEFYDVPSGNIVNSDLGLYFANLFGLDLDRITWEYRYD
jgi:hypothetical protein